MGGQLSCETESGGGAPEAHPNVSYTNANNYMYSTRILYWYAICPKVCGHSYLILCGPVLWCRELSYGKSVAYIDISDVSVLPILRWPCFSIGRTWLACCRALNSTTSNTLGMNWHTDSEPDLIIWHPCNQAPNVCGEASQKAVRAAY